MQALDVHRAVNNWRNEGVALCEYALLQQALGCISDAQESWQNGASILKSQKDAPEMRRLEASMREACTKAGRPTLQAQILAATNDLAEQPAPELFYVAAPFGAGETCSARDNQGVQNAMLSVMSRAILISQRERLSIEFCCPDDLLDPNSPRKTAVVAC